MLAEIKLTDAWKARRNTALDNWDTLRTPIYQQEHAQLGLDSLLNAEEVINPFDPGVFEFDRPGLIISSDVDVCVCVPHWVCGPTGLNWCRQCRAWTHQHGAIDVCCHHQDAEEDGPNDRPLQAKIVCPTCNRKACEVWMPPSEKQKQ